MPRLLPPSKPDILARTGHSVAVFDAHMTIEAGEIFVIMGLSGSGKSTLLHILGMLDEASEGEYLFLDKPVHKLSEKQRGELHKDSIGFVFQSYHLIDELTVYENIETPLLYQSIKKDERKSMVADILDRFNIVAKKDLFPHQLSGGQQQLVGIARAVIARPKVIFADEPTGNLDELTGEAIHSLIRQLQIEEQLTAIIVTHNERLASTCDRVLRLENGRLNEF